jgi:hypothetical protein
MLLSTTKWNSQKSSNDNKNSKGNLLGKWEDADRLETTTTTATTITATATAIAAIAAIVSETAIVSAQMCLQLPVFAVVRLGIMPTPATTRSVHPLQEDMFSLTIKKGIVGNNGNCKARDRWMVSTPLLFCVERDKKDKVSSSHACGKDV